jgi:hypothetical protein
VVSRPADAAAVALAAEALLGVVLETLGGGLPPVEIRDDEGSLLAADGREVLEVATGWEIGDAGFRGDVGVPGACLGYEGDRDLSVEPLSAV